MGDQNSLVLGGTSFVGGRLVEHLLAAGHRVSVLNRARTGVAAAGVDVLVADRGDTASMRAALAGSDWDTVFDVSGVLKVAGAPGVFESTVDTLTGRVGRYVFVSSIMVYQPTGVFPWAEDAPLRTPGHDDYGAFKSHAEQVLSNSRIAATSVRPAAIYGPGNNIYGMETAMFLRLQRGLPILLPHTGLVTGSYGHVDDLCTGMLTLAADPDAAGRAYNVTSDAVTSRHYVETLAEIVGVEPDVVEIPDAVLPTLDNPAFGHLFGARHHAMLDIRRAVAAGIPARDFRTGHADTYRWFLDSPLVDITDGASDPLWEKGFDLAYEASVAAGLR